MASSRKIRPWGPVLWMAIGLLTGFVLPGSVAAGEDTPAVWLERMVTSVHAHSYEGTFILQRGERIDTVQVVHASEEGGYRERLRTLTGSAREVIRSVDRLGTLKGVRVETDGAPEDVPQRPPALGAALVAADGRYVLKSPGDDRVAGFPCYLLHAQAQDDYRYSHTYCLHRDTGLPLLSELLNAEGQLLERLVFTELTFLDVVFEESLEPHGCDTRHIEVHAAEGATGADSYDEWFFEGLPPGFRQVLRTERHFGSEDTQPSLHVVLSDGLATVSVYMDRGREPTEAFAGATRSGATHAVARPVAGHQLTVVGEVPKKTVEAIIDAARFRPHSGSDDAGP